MIEIKFKLLRENSLLPKAGTEHAACYDCYASEIEKQQDGSIHVKLGFATEIPEGWRADLIPRSNITKHGWVLSNSPGTIDSDFRNEWQARFRLIPFEYIHDSEEGVDISSFFARVDKNISLLMPLLDVKPFPYSVGDRVCQVRFEKVNRVKLTIVEELSDTERGLGGFGSTGVK